jgi:holin-like protein
MGLVLGLTVIGDAVAESLAVPVPGAAIGMMVLASVFAVRGGADSASEQIFDVTAPHIPLFFVPAAAGIVASTDLLARAWLSVCVAIVLGTAVTLITTGTLAQVLLRRVAKGGTA